MRAVGIVCEYNPFHRGHLYHIEASRRCLDEEAVVVCVMSGDFVQRGEAAVFDKFTRAEAACRCGADLVVELPLPWCLSGAEGFASGAVSLLNALGCAAVSFGSESGDLETLKQLAVFAADPDSVSRIRALMDADGTLSFARARQLAAREIFGEKAALLAQPNDILAVEYLKALKETCMEPIAVRRFGSGHDSTDDGEIRSAMRLRELMESGEDVSPHIPPQAAEAYRRARLEGRARDRRLLEIALLSRLYAMRAGEFDALPDAGGGAGRRLFKALQAGGDLERIASAAASRRYTAARMRRMLLCAALSVCADDTKDAPPYLRILATDGKGREYLRSVREKVAVPVLNKGADARKNGKKAEEIFSIGAGAHALYCLQFRRNEDRMCDEDWKKAAFIV